MGQDVPLPTLSESHLTNVTSWLSEVNEERFGPVLNDSWIWVEFVWLVTDPSVRTRLMPHVRGLPCADFIASEIRRDSLYSHSVFRTI